MLWFHEDNIVCHGQITALPLGLNVADETSGPFDTQVVDVSLDVCHSNLVPSTVSSFRSATKLEPT